MLCQYIFVTFNKIVTFYFLEILIFTKKRDIMMNSTKISERIKFLREKNNLTQSELAERIGVKRETINQWEKGTRDLKTGHIIELSNFFNVPSDFILGIINTENRNYVDIGSIIGLDDFTITRLEHSHKEKTPECDIINNVVHSSAFSRLYHSLEEYQQIRSRFENVNKEVDVLNIKDDNIKRLSESDKAVLLQYLFPLFGADMRNAALYSIERAIDHLSEDLKKKYLEENAPHSATHTLMFPQNESE